MGKIMFHDVNYSAPNAGRNGVTGVKGSEEDIYRTGDVNLTLENIGAAPNKIVESQNFNNMIAPGFYSMRNPVSEKPASGQQFGLLVFRSQSSNGLCNVLQITHGEDQDTNVQLGNVYIRRGIGYAYTLSGWTWSDWEKLGETDGDKNIITDTYAKKSIYGNTTVSMDRKSGTEIGVNSFAFGIGVEASNLCTHAEGYQTTASGYCSHAEGSSSTARGSYSHSEGMNALAIGEGSHAEGYRTCAEGNYSHTAGWYTSSGNYAACTVGKLNTNLEDGGSYNNQIGDAFVVGNGIREIADSGMPGLSNALRVTYQGDILGTRAFQSSGADYAEFIKPWSDGNPDGEDRVGYFVTIKNGALHKADPGDYIAGITSGNPSIVGNADEDYYWRYERDEFNRIVLEDVPEVVQKTDENGVPVLDEETHQPIMVETGNTIPNARMKLAQDYDPSLQNTYIERKNRKEWDYVGMLGVLPVRDDGTCIPGQFCKCKAGGIATHTPARSFDTFFVVERISNSIVSVILK